MNLHLLSLYVCFWLRKTVWLWVFYLQVSGEKGAQKISALLQARGVQLAFLVDEGSFILEGFIPNLEKPVAM
jgi:hypothetical protein